jgi:hypothetical protein
MLPASAGRRSLTHDSTHWYNRKPPSVAHLCAGSWAVPPRSAFGVRKIRTSSELGIAQGFSRP